MNIQVLAVFCVVQFAACNISQAADWQHFSSSTDGNKGFIDYDRIKRDPYGVNTYRAWWRADLAKPTKAKGKTFVSHLSLYRVDCDKLTLTTLAAHYYDAKGNIVFSEEWESAASAVIPDSTGETFANATCSAAKIRGL